MRVSLLLLLHLRKSKKRRSYLHFDSLVPVDNVSAERESLDVDHVHVAAFRAYVDPFRRQRQVQARDPGNTTSC